MNQPVAFAACLIAVVGSACSLGTDLGAYTTPPDNDAVGVGDADADADGADLDTSPGDVPDNEDEPPSDVGDIVDIDDTTPDTGDAEPDTDADPACVERCGQAPNTQVLCRDQCEFSCLPTFVDVDGDLDDGPTGNGCECRRTSETEVCGDGEDNNCDGVIDTVCCDQEGWLPIASARISADRPTVALTDFGAVLVAWEEPTQSGGEIHLVLVPAPGRLPVPTLIPLDTIGPEGGAHDVSVFVHNGEFGVGWVESGEPPNETLMVRMHGAVDGVPTTDATPFNTATTDVPIPHATVGSLGSARLGAVWSQRSRADIVDDPRDCVTGEFCVRFAPRGGSVSTLVAGDSAARFGRARLASTQTHAGVTFFDNGEIDRSVQLAIIDTRVTGTITFKGDLTRQARVNDSDPDLIPWLDGSYLVGWSDPDFQALALDVLPAEEVTRRVFAGTGALDPRMARTNGGAFTVVWQDGGNLLTTHFSGGLAMDGEIRLLRSALPPITAHDVSSAGTPAFAVVAVGSGRVFLARYDTAGDPICP